MDIDAKTTTILLVGALTLVLVVVAVVMLLNIGGFLRTAPVVNPIVGRCICHSCADPQGGPDLCQHAWPVGGTCDRHEVRYEAIRTRDECENPPTPHVCSGYRQGEDEPSEGSAVVCSWRYVNSYTGAEAVR